MQTQTAEAVCIGHPDKLCDLIADTITTEALLCDAHAHCALEVLASGRRIFVAGEISCTKTLSIRELVRSALTRAGYDASAFKIDVFVHAQSIDIANGISKSLEARTSSSEPDTFEALGAGDQGIVYGYATDETEKRLPKAYVLATSLCRLLDQAREKETIKGIFSDGKAQVTLSFDSGETRVDTIVISVQTDATKSLTELKTEVFEQVIVPACKDIAKLSADTRILINPAGAFVLGGPEADTGLTGRKLMVDTYGGLSCHGGGAFSGKDGTKVDRSGAYMARLIAKTIVDARLAKRARVSVAYAIGLSAPVAIDVNTFGTGTHSDKELARAIPRVFDLRPAAMIHELQLDGSFDLTRTASYGHFTLDSAPWENTERYRDKLIREVCHAH